MHFLQNCIGPTIRIGRESWCLPYAGFFRQSSYCLHCRPPVSLEEGSWESGCVSGQLASIMEENTGDRSINADCFSAPDRSLTRQSGGVTTPASLVVPHSWPVKWCHTACQSGGVHRLASPVVSHSSPVWWCFTARYSSNVSLLVSLVVSHSSPVWWCHTACQFGSVTQSIDTPSP